MDATEIVRTVLQLLLGGGLGVTVVKFLKARPEVRQIEEETRALGIRTDAEVESVSMATMRTALTAAHETIQQMTDDRERDRGYYNGRIEELEDRVQQLLHQLRDVEGQLTKALEDAQQAALDIASLRQNRTDA